jgi:hypothetical protein
VTNINDVVSGIHQKRIFAGRVGFDDFAHQFLPRCVAGGDNPIEAFEPSGTADFTPALFRRERTEDLLRPGLIRSAKPE